MIRIADDVGVEIHEDVVYVAALPDGPIVVLREIAGLIWTEACALPREDIARSVAEQTDRDVSEVRGHVDGFVSEMLARGLLVED